MFGRVKSCQEVLENDKKRVLRAEDINQLKVKMQYMHRKKTVKFGTTMVMGEKKESKKMSQESSQNYSINGGLIEFFNDI